MSAPFMDLTIKNHAKDVNGGSDLCAEETTDGKKTGP
jgi:hypothetical protein